jgi:hypothetical protein
MQKKLRESINNAQLNRLPDRVEKRDHAGVLHQYVVEYYYSDLIDFVQLLKNPLASPVVEQWQDVDASVQYGYGDELGALLIFSRPGGDIFVMGLGNFVALEGLNYIYLWNTDLAVTTLDSFLALQESVNT